MVKATETEKNIHFLLNSFDHSFVEIHFQDQTYCQTKKQATGQASTKK